MRRTRHRTGTSLVETIAATIIAATILVPLVGMLRSGALQEQRCRVRDRMVAEAQTIIDKIRIATATPAVFTSAAYGVLPAGVSADQLITVAPGEQARFRVEVSPADASRDFIMVNVTGVHETSGTETIPQVRVFTAIARPW